MGEAPQTDPPKEEEAFIRAYGEGFALYHHAWSVFFVSHMGDLRRHFGDLDEALLLAAFGLGPVADKRRAAGRNRDALALGGRAVSEGVTNAKRLADVTGIPRETVRRKLERFRARGWVEQDRDGAWRLSLDAEGKARVAEALGPLHGAFLRRLARLVVEFARLERR
jgi:DNA-binding transcriptional ArsR family regulator